MEEKLIWTFDDAEKTQSDEQDMLSERQEYVVATLRHAEYNQEKQMILLTVSLPNSELRSVVWAKTCFSFKGIPSDRAPKELVDKEMEKTTSMLLRRIGKPIGKILAYSSQLKGN